MSYTKNYVNWIDGLTKDQFDDFIKAFIMDYWKIETVSITDGTNDGGIDVKIIEDKKSKKIPIQITVDKNLYGKLGKDLTKVSKLIDEHDYSNSFFFYYSKGASEDKVIDLVDLAREDFSIDLKLFDNKLIATYLDKPNFYRSRESLRQVFGDFFNDEESYFDENQKMYFDYLSYADDSQELKERFITSFILNEFYKSSDNETTIGSIVEKVKKEFGAQTSENYCARLINLLSTNKKIEKCTNGNFKLTDSERRLIKEIRENSKLSEREFSSKLQNLINKKDSELEIRLVIEKLNAIFESQHEIDISEISSLTSEEGTNKEIKEFYDYVKGCFGESLNYKQFLEDVFNLCIENNFLAKISAGKLFKNLMDNPEFSEYSRRTNKEVFIDTPVLIYLLLVLKEKDYKYDNYKFKIAKELFDLISSDDESACYNTTQHYIKELGDYFKNAARLIPIQESGLFDSLGGSKNEILNFYMSLKKDKIFTNSFKEFIESFGVNVSRIESDEQNNYLDQYLIRLFKDNGISIDDVPAYNTDFYNKYDYGRIEKTIAEIYSRSGISRKPRSLKFDSLLFMHIYSIKEDLVDPTVITWDKSFNLFRKEFQPKNPNFRYWHLFTPGKFLDHISLLKFKINGGAISNEILSMIETDYEVIKRVRKLSDVLTSIIDLKSSSGINLTKGLADIRETYVYEINKEHDEKVDSTEIQPVDEAVSNLVDYYSSSIGKYNFDDFVESLRDQSVINQLLVMLEDEMNYFIKYNKLSTKYKKRFDKIIKVSKSSEL
ncbi:hypothetical protein [Allomuricauda sp. R78024]|uniref:hypothetical protein n=1 Tax=Allomuricauda sp. R78024 TaxID=3093867 RepID=UPI0037C662D4